MQTQLDGVQKGLQSLQDLEKVVMDIKGHMGDVGRLYQDCAELSDVVKPIRDVNRKHQQVSTSSSSPCTYLTMATVVMETVTMATGAMAHNDFKNLRVM